MAVGSWLGRTRGQGLHGKSRLNPQAQPSIHSTLFWYQGHHFPLNIYSLQGRELLCSSKPFHFPGQQEDYISCLLCSQIWPRDWVLSSRMYKPLPGLANKTTPCDPSAHSPASYHPTPSPMAYQVLVSWHALGGVGLGWASGL